MYTYMYVYIHIYIYIYVHIHVCIHTYIYRPLQLITFTSTQMLKLIHNMIGLVCTISSLSQVSFAKETYYFKEPTNHSHPIRSRALRSSSSYTCAHIYTYAYTHVYKYIYTYISIHVYIRMYIYLHICIDLRS